MRKNVIKLVLIILSVIVLAYVMNACFGGHLSHNIKYYNDLAEKYSYLPAIDELGNYEDYKFKYFNDYMFIFSAESYVLRVRYNEAEYKAQKELVLKKYIFETEKLIHMPDIEDYKEPSFTIDTFEMNTLSIKQYKLDYPKNLVFVGTSDETCEISYVCFIDWDIDFIDMSFEEFLRDMCRW